MPNKYYITESQLKQLVAKKKKDKRVAEEIQSKIDRYSKSLNESKMQKSAIKTILERYNQKGLLNNAVINHLKNQNDKES